jgi:hypothetical protein
MSQQKLFLIKTEKEAADWIEMDDNFTKMAAMGRRFQMGDLYDYHTDNVLSSKL